MKIQSIGVIGAGVMGSGLSHHIASCGLRAVLIDNSESALKAAQNDIEKNIKYYSLINKQLAGNASETIQRIQFTSNLNSLSDVDFVVENITENINEKEKLYSEIDRICREDVVFAVNTSCYSITKIGGLTDRPQNVIGIHFMNPVPLKEYVECIKGYHTSDDTIAVASSFLKKIGKEVIIVNDSPGFVSNRILMPTINEAIYLIYEGVSKANDIDLLFRKCMGHKMGPLETADLIGLDTILHSIQVLYDSYADCKYRPCPLLKNMVAAGILGRKSGQGFYNY